MWGYLVVLAVAAGVTGALLPLAIRIGYRFGVLALPDAERRLHPRATPLLGGVAMCVGFLAALVVAWRLHQFREVFTSSSEVLGVAVGALVITAVGLADDVWEVSPPAKLAGQVLAGTTLYLLGATLDAIQLPFIGNLQISADLTPLLTVLWVVGMANAINLIDGLDGLAGGIVAISSGAFLLYGAKLQDGQIIGRANMGPLLAAIACGVCLGFLPFNVNPARVFMGDSGALLLGLLMAASTMVVGGRAVPGVSVRGQAYFFLAPLFIPLLMLAVPILDTALAIVRRTINRTGIANADRQHLHYRLLELGHGPRRSVVILWSLTSLLSGFALAPVWFRSRLPMIPLSFGLVAVAVFALRPPEPGMPSATRVALRNAVSRVRRGDPAD